MRTAAVLALCVPIAGCSRPAASLLGDDLHRNRPIDGIVHGCYHGRRHNDTPEFDDQGVDDYVYLVRSDDGRQADGIVSGAVDPFRISRVPGGRDRSRIRATALGTPNFYRIGS